MKKKNSEGKNVEKFFLEPMANAIDNTNRTISNETLKKNVHFAIFTWQCCALVASASISSVINWKNCAISIPDRFSFFLLVIHCRLINYSIQLTEH